jgi:DNA-binding transcriptional MocR family regulator
VVTTDSLQAPERLAASILEEMQHRPPGALLPSVRDLQKRYRVSPVTVTKALSLLRKRGLVSVRPGHGSFLAETTKIRPEGDVSWQSLVLGARSANPLETHMCQVPPDDIALNGGYMSADLQPVKELKKFAVSAAARATIWGQSPVEGLPELRAWFAEEHGPGYRAHDVLIAHGGQQAISTTFRAAANPGASILVESPTYVGALAAAYAAGVKAVPVPTDEDGVRPEALEAAFAQTRAPVFYCQPLHSNPSGVTLSLARRQAVLEIARAANAFVLEDDSTRYLDFGAKEPPPTLASLDPSRVILIRSVTKPTAPSVRIAAIFCKGPIRERIKSLRVTDDMFTGGFTQELFLEFVASSAWGRHMARLKEGLAAKRDLALAMVRRYIGDAAVSKPEGGLHLWLRLPEHVDETTFVANALRQRVHVSAGRLWFPADAPAGYVRISYGCATRDEIEQGIAILGGLLREQQAA